MTHEQKVVLVVDDDESVRDLLAFMIKKEGFRVELASTGLEGFKKAVELLPAVIIMDLMLPKQGGFETIRQLQAEETRKIPVIVITGRYGDRATLEMMRQEPNVIDVLTKPINPAAFGMMLQRLLSTPATSESFRTTSKKLDRPPSNREAYMTAPIPTPEDAISEAPRKVKELLITGAGNPRGTRTAAIAVCRAAIRRVFLSSGDIPSAAIGLLQDLHTVAQKTNFDPAEVMNWGRVGGAFGRPIGFSPRRRSARDVRRCHCLAPCRHNGRGVDISEAVWRVGHGPP